MTHMDDQLAKHIKEMILRARRKPIESQGQPTKPDSLRQVAQALTSGPDFPYDLVRLARLPWPDEGSKT
jgi:hypothetical protein